MEEKWIEKASGERVKFEPEKLRDSLFKSGANNELIDKILQCVHDEIDDVSTTKVIYQKAYKLLRASSKKLAGKYRLKNAILDLGPSGYPFEQYLGYLFSFQHYKTQVGITLDGKCVTHEVDIMAEGEDKTLLVECKHHGNPGYKSDVKIPLYIHSRFNDLVNAFRRKGDERKFECWIATNTRFTQDAVDYANCYGIRLLAWDYPSKGSLRERIELAGMYPITCLFSLTKNEKQKLLKDDIVLCRQLTGQPELLNNYMNEKKQQRVLEECESILS